MAYTKPSLRERIKNEVMADSKGGKPGQWSARKSQLLNQKYEKAGGGYSGKKTEGQKSLSKWTKEKWGTKSGKPSTQGPKATGERYLPLKALKSLSSKEYASTTRAKRKGTKEGKQFVKQPKKIAKKTASYR
jgi:UTP:GlnB (protein PII) uridylyltransferase